MGSDGEIGGRCSRPLNGSLRCDGKNDDCVPCWCLRGMIQLVIGGWGVEKEEKCFRSSAFEAAICSIIEPNCAKLNGAVSLPNPSTVSCSELEQTAGLSWLWNKQSWSYLTHYMWNPVPLKAKCTCVILHLPTNRHCLLSWLQFPVLVMLFCKQALALMKLHLASLSNIYQHFRSIRVLKCKRQSIWIEFQPDMIFPSVARLRS